MRPFLTGSLSLERVTVPVPNLPDPLQGCTIAQLSDFHYDGERLPTTLLEAAIDRVNGLQVDLIALTGDYVTTNPRSIRQLTPYLEQLKSRCGCVAVLGNHDNIFRQGRQLILRELTQVGIQPLWDQITYPLGPDFPVVGLADFWSREFNPQPLLAPLPQHQPRLVLVHNPDSAARLGEWRIDLQLSGHTHGGQIVLPLVGPALSLINTLGLTRLARLPLPYCDRLEQIHSVQHWEWASGLHRIGQNWLYVNRGLGSYAPGRIWCPPEVTLITLVKYSTDWRGLSSS
jgi:hypothetical protein